MSEHPCETPAVQNPQEISINRYIEAPPAVVWKVMTERLTEWWCPKPWLTEVTRIEWRSGGALETIMRGPEGQQMVNRGVFLEVTTERRMVFTDAVDADWMPQGPFMIGMLEIEAEGKGTRYTGRARHWTADARREHEEMGFIAGWSAVADQLAALVEST